MPQSSMEIKVEQDKLKLSGKFSLVELTQMNYNKITLATNKSYTLCCAGVEQINTFFVAWLVGLQRTLHHRGSHFTIINSPTTLKNLIGLYRLQATLQIREADQ